MKELLFVTWNQNKINEAQLYLQWFVVNKAWIEVPEIQSVDVVEVVKAKLESAFYQTQKPCFVMDAWLIIEWMCKQNLTEKKFPWALIKDVFWNMWDENITKIVELNWNSKCIWKSILWYHDWVNKYYFEESLAWNIPNYPKGENWYDWDTIFIPKGESRTFAQMSFDEKQKYALTSNLYKQFYIFLTKQ